MQPYEYEEKIASLKHEPLIQRLETRELIAAALWRAYMESEPSTSDRDNYGAGAFRIASVTHHYPHALGQHQADLMASIFTWFGTNVGQGFLEKAFELKDQFKGTFYNFMHIAWAKENQRVGFMGNGYRTLEVIGSPDHDRPVDPPQEDYELIEHMMEYLGEGLGLAFLEDVNMIIQRARRAKLSVVPAYKAGGYEAVIEELEQTVAPEVRNLVK